MTASSQPSVPLLRLYVDGASRGNPGPAAGGIVITDRTGQPLVERGVFLGRATNNVAEYSALIRGLELAAQFKPQRIEILADSQLMVRQITGEYRVKSEDLAPLHEQAQLKLLGFDSWQISHIPRKQNARADALANKALDAKADVDEAGGRVAAPDADESDPSSGPVVVARVSLGCDPRACPATMIVGETFEIGLTTPAGLCSYAAAAIMNAAVGLLNEAQVMDHPRPDPAEVRCQRPGCGARFQLTLRTE